MPADPRADGREQRGDGTEEGRRQDPLTEVGRQGERTFAHDSRYFNTPANRGTLVPSGEQVILVHLPAIATTCRAEVAQLVEHVTENHGVGGSIPSLGTTS